MLDRLLGLTPALGILLGPVLALGGCALFGAGHTVHATLAQQGRVMRLSPGDDLAVTLPNVSGPSASASRGFDWAPAAYDEDVLSYDDDPEHIRSLRNGKPDPWAPAFERHTFRARGTGKGEILMGAPGAEPLEGGLSGRAFRLGVIVR